MENIKVMLVDDEILAIEYLRNMIRWEEYGFEVVAEATDGKKALAQFDKYHPQIIFVDIRMPIMDGLEFCRRLVSKGFPAKIILLTAYRDFDYARQAIAIGVNSYILKHDIHQETLLQELKKAQKELEQEDIRSRILRRNFFYNVINGIKPIEYGSDSIHTVFNNESFALMIFQLDLPYRILEEIPQEGSLHIPPISIEFEELPRFAHYMESLEISNKCFLSIVSVKKVHSKMETLWGLNELAGKTQTKFRSLCNGTLSCVISDMVHDAESMHSACDKLLKALELGIFYGKEKILLLSNLEFKNADQDFINLLLKKINELHNHLHIEGLSEYFKQLFEAAYLCPAVLKRICKALLSMLESFDKKYNIESFNSKTINKEAELFYDGKGIERWFLEKFKGSIETAEKTRSNTYSKKVQQALDYIHLNYGKDLSIEQVAHNIDISSVYLMKLFTREVGQTFLEYLTSYRIHTAKKLLSEGRLKIYEISELVGYKSSQYFSQVFKKITGKNPFDYKDGE